MDEMTREKAIELLRGREEGVKVWNEWRRNPDIALPDLEGANLEGAALFKANLFQVNLVRANFRWAQLNLAILAAANLEGANFGEAGLEWTNLRHANLEGANLFGANLEGVNLYRAILAQTNLGEATLGESFFTDVDLSHTKYLDMCRHFRPSVIDYRTLERSRNLPLEFLRGCGLSDVIIENIPALFHGSPIEFYSVFLGYSTLDHTFAERLHADLQNKGIRCWFAPHDIQSGRKIHQQIDEAIRVYDRLLVILSENSMNSEWVKTEIAKARRRELAENRRMLFPIGLAPFDAIRDWECFDADTGKDSAREIREYFIPDFTNWITDHDAYKKAFERLLRDLKKTPE